MSADLLREAAAKARELAQAATPGPWWLDSYVEDGQETITDTILAPSSADAVARGADEVQELGSLFPVANAKHCAAWGTAVALAVADSWERWAELCDYNTQRGRVTRSECYTATVAFARVFLGEQS